MRCGAVEVNGRELPARLSERSASDVAALQIVFQNPDSAPNRRHTVRRMLKRPLAKLAGVSQADERAQELVVAVRLPERALSAEHTRCPRFLRSICETEEPPLIEVEPDPGMRCHIPVEALRRLQTAKQATA